MFPSHPDGEGTDRWECRKEVETDSALQKQILVHI